LVVDTKESAQYLNEFLKEKGLYKDVLVLQNIPDKKSNDEMRAKVRKLKAGYIRDVVEVQRGIPNLDKAVNYFIANKVLCDTFEQAEELQKLKVKEIITLDGT
jgi:chromosome segregation ATPase